jgi:anaerobic magnesium-protoporphyrin IX monomethyl ester cyclase
MLNRRQIGIELEPKILLVNPPFKYLMTPPVIPLGLINLGTILLDHGCDVKLLDCMAEKENELRYLPDVLSPKELLRDVKKFAPDIIGITSCTENYPIALAIAQLCKKEDTNVKILLGGSHVSFQARECLTNHAFIDAVAIGETEHVIIDIIEGLSGKRALENIPNLAYRANQAIKAEDSMTVPMLKTISAPNLDLIKHKHYPSYLCHVEFSRGCPYKCNFCSVNPFSNNQVRYFPISRIMECLSSYAEFFKDFHFFVTDPTFLLNHKQILRFVEELKAAKFQLPLWDFQTRVDLLSREILGVLKKINAYEITLGIEDIHDSVLQIIGKDQTISQVERAIKLIGELGLKSHSNFIIGLPTQTKDQALETITYASKLDRFNFSTIKPFPGTPLFTKPKAFGMAILTKNWEKYNSFEIVMDSHAFPIHNQEQVREHALRHYAQVHIERDLFDIYAYAEYKYLLNFGFDPWYARWKKEHWSGWN